MMQISYAQFSLFALPEIIVAATALLVLLSDVVLLRKNRLAARFGVSVGLGSFGCVLAIVRLCSMPAQSLVAGGVFVVSPLTRFTVVGLLVLTIITLLVSVSSLWTEHVGEYVALVLLAAVGMMFLVSTRNLLVLFVSLELLSLCLYLLTAFDKHGPKAAEASLKYFLFGGMSAAFLLYGFSMLYGLANSTDLAVIGQEVERRGNNSLVIFALVTTVIGFGFKVAAVPLHFWVPDVYESAPNPVTGFIASASKLASLVAFYTVLTVGFGDFGGSADWSSVREGWVPVVAALAAASMIVGNVGALAQTSMRRLLGYSAIAHSGYMLIAIVSHTEESIGALLYYVLTYGVTALGSFAVIAVVQEKTGSEKLAAMDGLSRRMPLLSGCLFVFLMSQAGIPPLAGFFGKFFLFISAVDGPDHNRGLLWLVVLALATSAISLYYYLKVLKRVFVCDAPTGALPIASSLLTRVVISFLALTTVALGCAPNTLLRWIQEALPNAVK